MGGRRECTPRAAIQGRIALASEVDRATDSMTRWLFSRILHLTAPTATPQRPPMPRHQPICRITPRPWNEPQNHCQTPNSTQGFGQLKACLALGEKFITPFPHHHHRSFILANFRRKSAVLSHFPLQGQAIDAPPPIVFPNPSDHRRAKPAVGIVKQGPAHPGNLTQQTRSARTER